MFRALLERQRVTQERAFFPTACLLAQGRNLAFGVKHDKQYSAEDFMPKRHSKAKAGLGPEVAAHWLTEAAKNGQ